MKNVLSVLISLFLVVTAAGTPDDSVGKIKGTVNELQEGQQVPVPFANVFLAGTTIGGTTDFDGNFEFNAEPGEYKLIVSSVGYTSDTIDVQIEAGQVVVQELEMRTNAQLLQTFEVKAKLDRSSESLLLMQQMDASTMQQSVGAKELSVVGASDVEQGLAKMSGISKSDASNDIFVRGLGDRYNSATLNGLPIPSSDPDKKVIPLSIFPTSVVEAIDVRKAAQADIQSDFAGAAINITTKSYYENPYAEFGLGVKFNTQTTFKDFQMVRQDSLSRFGYGYTNRAVPQEIAEDGLDSYYSSPADQSRSPFKRNFNPVITRALPGFTTSVLGGNSYKFKEQGLIGFMVSAQHSDEYLYRNGLARNTDSSGVDKNYFTTESFEYKTQTTALGNLYLELSPRHRILFYGLTTRNSNDQVSNYDSQILDRDRNTYTYSVRNTLRLNSLMTGQVLGTHSNKTERFTFSWAGSASKASNSEPDRTQLLFEASDETKSDYRLEALNASDNHRFFSEVLENELSGRADVNWSFLQDGESGKSRGRLKVGSSIRKKGREFTWRQFNMGMTSYADSLQNNDIVVDIQNPDEFLGAEAFTSGLYDYEEARDGSRRHFASQSVIAAYSMVDVELTKRLLLVAGLRMEKTSQEIRYKQLRNLISDPYQVNSYDTINILPSASIRYKVDERSNLRFAVSQTVSRPNFRELAPFQYQDQSRRLYEGNLDLVNAYAYNADLKYEISPSGGHVFAVSVYGKYIDNPIERYEVPSSTTLFTYFNMGHVIAAGVESEVKTTLGYVFRRSVERETFLERTSIGLNLAYNYTQLYVGSDEEINTSKGTILTTNARRPMQGASPYLISANVGHKMTFGNIKSNLSLVYNVFGSRVYLAGTYGRGDVYESPVSTLDLVWKNELNSRISLDVSVKNILNPTIRQEQINAGEVFTFNEYKLGTNIGVSFAYKFFKADGE